MMELHRLKLTNFKQIASLDLTFPKQGTILIEGHNEAGKSSLFEAVFFALYGDSLPGGVNNPELKRYGQDSMEVELWFSIHERDFHIARSMKKNQAKALLKCPTPDGKEETISSLKECNKRLLQELDLTETSLLNTCFVEQKNLEKLESLSKAERDKTIHELLNIEVFTALADSFKFSRDEDMVLYQQTQRLAVATLDTEIPILTQQRDAEKRCYLFREALDLHDQSSGLQSEISSLQDGQVKLQAGIDNIEKTLAEGGAVAQRIERLKNVLPPRLNSWQQAYDTHQKGLKEIQSLEVIQQRLPQTRQELDLLQSKSQSLQSLENLEAEINVLEKDQQSLQTEAAQYQLLCKEQEQNKSFLATLEEAHSLAETRHQEASQLWQHRQAQNDRMRDMKTLQSHLQAHKTAQQDASDLRSEIHRIQKTVEASPELEARRNGLTKAQNLLNNKIQNQQAYEETLKRETGLAQLLTDEKKLEDLQKTVLEAQSRLLQAQHEVQLAERRNALSQWIAAKEQAESVTPNAQSSPDTQKAQSQAEATLKAHEMAYKKAQQQKTGAITLLVSGGVAIVAAALAHLLIPLIALGVVLILVGGGVFVKADKEAKQATQGVEEAKKQRDTLVVERKVQEGVAQQWAHQRAEFQKQEAIAREALEKTGLSLPQTLQQAKELLNSLPDRSMQSCKEVVERDQKAHQQLTIDVQTRMGILQQNRRDLLGLQEADIASAEQSVKEEKQRLKERLNTLEKDLQLLFESLNIEGVAEKIAEALHHLAGEVALAQSGIAKLSNLENQASQKETTATQTAEDAHRLANQLALQGADFEVWDSQIQHAMVAFQQSQQASPSSELAINAETAQNAVQGAQTKVTQAKATLAQLQRQIDAIPIETTMSHLKERQKLLEESNSKQQALSEVRLRLEQHGLPTQYTRFASHLSAREATYESEAGRVETLSTLLEMHEKQREQVAIKQSDFEKAWGEVDEGAPPDLADSEALIVDIQAQWQAYYNNLAIPAKEKEKQTLLKEKELRATDITEKSTHTRDLSQAIEARMNQLQITQRDVDTKGQTDPDLRQSTTQTVEAWRNQYEATQEEVRNRQAERRSLANTLGLNETLLELEAEQNTLALLRERKEVKNRAARIVADARKRIVEKVMPVTLGNTAIFLPALTAGRYREVEWTGERLSIFDERAGSYQSKRTFSGGAKDQISLALRLSFALATLPTGNMVRPNWLFLDEPLSSFDKERTLALVSLLTKGKIRQHFAQIFLVSHSEAFDPALFDYRIRMENGAVSESTLPNR